MPPSQNYPVTPLLGFTGSQQTDMDKKKGKHLETAVKQTPQKRRHEIKIGQQNLQMRTMLQV